MQLNVLNNLAEAMKALDGKKSVERPGESQEALDGKKIAGLICRCQNKIISWLACTKGLHCQLWRWCYSSLEAQEETLPILKAGDPGWIPNGFGDCSMSHRIACPEEVVKSSVIIGTTAFLSMLKTEKPA